MNRKKFIQVFEYQKLKHTDINDFTKSHFEAMVKFNEKNGNKYFTPIYNGIQFNSYVGVIQIGGLTIEILPKADKNDNPDKKTWQKVLLNMLKVCKHVQIDNVSETGLKKRYNSILDVYFEMYLAEIEYLVKSGLIKKYKKIQSNQLALKGKLVFAQNIQKNIVHKERFYCEHQIYDKDHLIHQILYKGLMVLDGLVTHHLRDKLQRLLFEFNEFKDVNITKTHFDKVVLNRKSIPYKRSLDIAKMLILNYSPNLNSGNDNMLTLLFDMNKLWEEYIYRILKKNEKDKYTVSYQNKQDFWDTKTIRPDILITFNNEKSKNFIIDTKWKIVDSNNPSDDDLKQMFTYNLHWEAEKSMLLYPRIDQKDSNFGIYHYKMKSFENEKTHFCKLGFINIIEEMKLRDDTDISKEIIEKFRHSP